MSTESHTGSCSSDSALCNDLHRKEAPTNEVASTATRKTSDIMRKANGRTSISDVHAQIPTSTALRTSCFKLSAFLANVPPTPARPFNMVMVSNSTSRGPVLLTSARQSIIQRSFAIANSMRAGRFCSGCPTILPSTETSLQSPTPLMVSCHSGEKGREPGTNTPCHAVSVPGFQPWSLRRPSLMTLHCGRAEGKPGSPVLPCG